MQGFSDATGRSSRISLSQAITLRYNAIINDLDMMPVNCHFCCGNLASLILNSHFYSTPLVSLSRSTGFQSLLSIPDHRNFAFLDITGFIGLFYRDYRLNVVCLCRFEPDFDRFAFSDIGTDLFLLHNRRFLVVLCCLRPSLEISRSLCRLASHQL